jgi:PhnB protein
MAIQPYLFFDGRCDEAIAFYKTALAAEVQMLLRHKDNPDPAANTCPTTPPPDKVMHAQLRIGDATVLVSDGHASGAPNFQGFGLSLTVPHEPAADRAFNALADGGQVRMPLAKTFFSPRFGMVADRFGVLWMVYVAPATHK